MKKRSVTLSAAIILMVTFATLQPAFACTAPPQTPPPVVVELHEICFPIDDPTHCMVRAWVTFVGYGTFFANGGQLCGCALNQVGEIKEVLYARLCDQATGERLPQFVFDVDPDVANGAAGVVGSGTFGGFEAELLDVINDGIQVDLKFEVLLNAGWISAGDVVTSILATPGSVVTGGVNAGGAFTTHIGTFPPIGEPPCEGQACPCQTSSVNIAFGNGAEDVLIARGAEIDKAVLQQCQVFSTQQRAEADRTGM